MLANDVTKVLSSTNDGCKLKCSEMISPSSLCMHTFKAMGQFCYATFILD